MMKQTFHLILILLTSCQISFAQWTQVDGTYSNNRISFVVESDSNIAIYGSCGLFSKQSISQDWVYATTINSSVSVYAQKGDSLFVADLSDNIYLIDIKHPTNAPILISTLHPTGLACSDSGLYAGEDYMGFGKFNPNNGTWNYVNQGLPIDTVVPPFPPNTTYYYKHIYSIEIGDNYIYAGTNKGVYRNTESLGTWESVNIGIPDTTIQLVKEMEGSLFAVTNSELYRSDNQGNSWTLEYVVPSNITTILKKGDDIYIGTTQNGVIYSANNGLTWNGLNMGLTDNHVTTIQYIDANIVVGTNRKGLFVLQGNQWLSNQKGMICAAISSMASTSQAVFGNSPEHVFEHKIGQNWADISPSLPHKYYSSLASTGTDVYLSIGYHRATFPNDSSYVVFHPNLTNSWQNLISPVPYVGDDAHTIHANNQYLYAREDDKMYYTDDLGANWYNISLPGQYCNMFYSSMLTPSHLYASACGNGEMLRLDANNAWTLINNGLPNQTISNLFSDGINIYTYFNYDGVYTSTNNGQTWLKMNDNLPQDLSIRHFTSHNGAIYLATNKGLFIKPAGQNTWHTSNTGLINTFLNAVVFFNDSLYVGTDGNGIWKQSVSNIMNTLALMPVSENKGINIYPNPASDKLNIQAANKEIMLENVQIFDNIGNVLFSQNIENNQLEIDINKLLPDGIYFVSIKTNNKLINSKISVVKY